MDEKKEKNFLLKWDEQWDSNFNVPFEEVFKGELRVVEPPENEEPAIIFAPEAKLKPALPFSLFIFVINSICIFLFSFGAIFFSYLYLPYILEYIFTSFPFNWLEYISYPLTLILGLIAFLTSNILCPSPNKKTSKKEQMQMALSVFVACFFLVVIDRIFVVNPIYLFVFIFWLFAFFYLFFDKATTLIWKILSKIFTFLPKIKLRKKAHKKNNKNTIDESLAKTLDEYKRALENENVKIKGLYDEAEKKIAEYSNEVQELWKKYRKLKEENQIHQEPLSNLENIFKILIPVFDAVFMANSEADKLENQGLAKGVNLTFDSFKTALNKLGLIPFSALGEKFDPTIHEAIGIIECAKEDENKVIKELYYGFYFRNAILRHPKVLVGQYTKEEKLNPITEK